MKYMITKIDVPDFPFTSVTIDSGNFVNFPAVVGNPNYDQFLVSAKLTDKKVKALEPNVWFNFPVDGGTK